MNAGRRLIAGAAVATAGTGFLADGNRTHLFNPRWTPHSKFHDGWLLSLNAGLGATAFRLVTRPRRPDPGLAAILLAQVWAAQASAYAYPGAAGIAAEFPDRATRPAVARLPEWVASAAALAVIGLGYGLDRRASRGPGRGRRGLLSRFSR